MSGVLVASRRIARIGCFCGVLALLMASVSGCAEGRMPPDKTEMVPVLGGLEFQFGLGQDACGVAAPGACTATSTSVLGAPALRLKLAAFAIDEHEVTNEQYRHCAELGVCSGPAADSTLGIGGYYAHTTPEGKTTPSARYGDHPVVNVTWDQASEYCRWAGKRLPTEFEWERVAAGASKTSAGKRTYAAELQTTKACDQAAINLNACNETEAPAAVKSNADDRVLEDGRSIYDLTGNAYEWTASPADPLVTCDKSKPYSCSACVTCLLTTGIAAACKLVCAPDKCGCGSEGPDRTACFAPCGRPVCAMYDDADLPIKPPADPDPTLRDRIVRGGSFMPGSGSGERQCEGRAAYRGKHQPHDVADQSIGFRCAKSL